MPEGRVAATAGRDRPGIALDAVDEDGHLLRCLSTLMRMLDLGVSAARAAALGSAAVGRSRSSVLLARGPLVSPADGFGLAGRGVASARGVEALGLFRHSREKPASPKTGRRATTESRKRRRGASVQTLVAQNPIARQPLR